MKRLLDHLKEAGFFARKDLETIDKKLLDYRDLVSRGTDRYSPHLLTLLEARIDICQKLVAEMQEMLGRIEPDLRPTYEKLVSILRSLSGCNVKSKVVICIQSSSTRSLLSISTRQKKSTITTLSSRRSKAN